MHAYQITLVTPVDVENGAIKGSTVYLHSQSKDNPGIFFFVTHPESDEGIPLEMHQVKRTPEHDLGVESTPKPQAEGERRVVVDEDCEPVTKEQQAQANGGMKFDAGKPQPMLLIGGMPIALEGVSAVLAFGAEKYEPHSWRTVPNGKERYSNALFRHLFAYLRGESTDDESGLHHLDHALTNLMFIRELDAQEKA
ncbi:hypothetical protein Stm18_024 [Stenotrophomonas phage Stm18]